MRSHGPDRDRLPLHLFLSPAQAHELVVQLEDAAVEILDHPAFTDADRARLDIIIARIRRNLQRCLDP